MDGQGKGDGGVEMGAGHAGGDVHAHRHRQAPGDVDREVAAVAAAAEDHLGHHRAAEHDEDERAQELGRRFPAGPAQHGGSSISRSAPLPLGGSDGGIDPLMLARQGFASCVRMLMGLC